MINKVFLIIFIFLNCPLVFAESYIKASNGIVWDKNNKMYSAEGNAEFKNDVMTAYANKIIAFYDIEDGKEIFQTVDLNKNVKIFYGDEVFTSETATYSKLTSTINLYGNVIIVSPDRYLSGDELLVDIENNTRVLKTNGSDDSLAEALIKNE